ncbi:hypothetical protein [Stutzerimonas kirkiae]|uniref:hypothetical protein n=1 Tax=Stutzerimonas kirkiae TaxID=2211392 RepID=UPI0010375870|nr:hypothetical protein [Stutzerimonas kirkiae]
MSKILQITPCSGWYYVSENNVEPLSFAVAAWGVIENGDVVGLIPVTDPDRKYPRLVPVPPLGGRYLQEDALSPTQRDRARRG